MNTTPEVMSVVEQLGLDNLYTLADFFHLNMEDGPLTETLRRAGDRLLHVHLADSNRDFRLRYPSGSRNDERNPSFWTLDMRLAKEFQLDRGVNLQLTVEAFNLLDDQTRVLENVIDAETAGQVRFGRQYQLGLRVGF